MKDKIKIADDMNRFPKDCWHKHCPYFHYWDMSVDDITCVCDKLHKKIDACDEDFQFYICPLRRKEKTT